MAIKFSCSLVGAVLAQACPEAHFRWAHDAVLLDRLADIDLSLVRHRRIGAGHDEAVARGMSALGRLAERLAFVRPPYDLANVAASADAFDAGLIVLDYVQRVEAFGDHGDRRGAVGATMGHLRQFADAGTAVVVVAALARSKDGKGRSSYGEGLNLASFRETSELEYGADDAFILAAAEGGEPPSRVVLNHLKSRNGETRDLTLEFDRKRQRFAPVGPADARPGAEPGRLRTALQALWDSTPPSLKGKGFGLRRRRRKPSSGGQSAKRRSRLRFRGS